MALKLGESGYRKGGSDLIIKGPLEVRPSITDQGLVFTAKDSIYGKGLADSIQKLPDMMQKIYYFTDYLNQENARTRDSEKGFFSRFLGTKKSTNDVLKEYVELKKGAKADKGELTEEAKKTLVSLINNTDKDAFPVNQLTKKVGDRMYKQAADNLRNLLTIKINKLREEKRERN